MALDRAVLAKANPEEDTGTNVVSFICSFPSVQPQTPFHALLNWRRNPVPTSVHESFTATSSPDRLMIVKAKYEIRHSR
jgi:hypothetical protein